MFFLVDLISVFGFCSEFITEDYTETHYLNNGTPVVTKPEEMVGGYSLAFNSVSRGPQMEIHL